MLEKKCLFCRNNDKTAEIYKNSLDFNNIKSKFVTTRTVDNNLHFRIVKCLECGLIFSNPVLEEEKLIELYKNSGSEKNSENIMAADTYFEYFKKMVLSKDVEVLEAGCGEGYFLKRLHDYGMKNITGVEPAKEAVDNAPPEIKSKIINDRFSKKLFNGKKFDLICAFMVIEHVIDPNDFLRECFELLKPNARMLIVSHNINSLLSKILGEKNPVINPGHIYYFDKLTLPRLLLQAGFKKAYSKSMKNNYRLRYWFEMTPLPRFIKNRLLDFLSFTKFENICFGIHAGNIITYAEK